MLDNGVVLSFVPLAGYHPLTAVFNQYFGDNVLVPAIMQPTIEPKSVLDIDIPEEKTSTKTSNEEGIPVTVTPKVRRTID